MSGRKLARGTTTLLYVEATCQLYDADLNRVGVRLPIYRIHTSVNQEPDAGRVAALDGVRGLAVLVVVVHNAAWIGGEPTGLAAKVFESAAAAGWVGVQLFFVLSGLLITNILLDSVGSEGFFRRFYIRRALRIAPLYYLVLSGVLLTAIVAGEHLQWSGLLLHEQWVYWLYLSNWIEPFGRGVPLLSHVWSLAVEEQFYLIWPVLVFALHRRGLTQLSWLLVISGPLVRLALHWAGLPPNSLYSFTISRWDALATGALLAISLRSPAQRRWLYANLGRGTGVLLLALFALVARQRGFHDGELPVQVVGQSVIALLSAALLAWAIAHNGQRNLGQRLLTGGLLPNLGQYSYAMYLLHIPLIRVWQPYLERWVNAPTSAGYLLREMAFCLLILVFAYLGARVSWAIIEAPLLSLKDRFAPRLRDTRVATTQSA